PSFSSPHPAPPELSTLSLHDALPISTALPRSSAAIAESGPNLGRRQDRLNALRDARLIDEDTVLPAVPLWFGTAQDDRAQSELEDRKSTRLNSSHLGISYAVFCLKKK